MIRGVEKIRDDAHAPDRRHIVTGLVALPVLAACSPTVRLEAPRDPIEINLNVRIEQEIRIKVDRELDALFDEEEDIF